jgi:hypothetical protein
MVSWFGTFNFTYYHWFQCVCHCVTPDCYCHYYYYHTNYTSPNCY